MQVRSTISVECDQTLNYYRLTCSPLEGRYSPSNMVSESLGPTTVDHHEVCLWQGLVQRATEYQSIGDEVHLYSTTSTS